MTGIRTNLLITTAVIVTVALALFMSQQDGRDGESLIANVVGTMEATAEGTAVTISLPTTTATVLEAVATVTVTTNEGKTAVSLLPSCDNFPAHWQAHTVHEGETIYSLSITTGATVAEIAQANCLAMEQMLTGLTIYLPPQPPTRIACGPPHWWHSQQVQAGDTLYSLAVRHGTTVYAIMQANCLSSSYLVAGRTLYLPPLVMTVTPIIIPPTATPTILPTIVQTAVPTSTPTVIPTPTTIPTPIPTVTPTATIIPPTMPPITPTMTLTPPPPTATNTPLPTDTATSTATPTSTAVIPTTTPTLIPPTATTIP